VSTYPVPSNHIHVSEREVAHRWPDGRYDNVAWEDCAWCVALMFARLLGKNPPATHAEAEALRAQAGEDTWSGSSVADVRLGLSRRYRLAVNPPVYGFTALWAKLKPGTAASVSGLLGVFPRGSRLRRHAAFGGTHQWLVMRLDDGNRVLVFDPLAPKGHKGDWVTAAELKRFVDGVGGWPQLYGRIVYPKTNVPASVLRVLRGYIAKLEVAKQTAAVRAKLALYRARLAEYLKRG